MRCISKLFNILLCLILIIQKLEVNVFKYLTNENILDEVSIVPTVTMPDEKQKKLMKLHLMILRKGLQIIVARQLSKTRLFIVVALLLDHRFLVEKNDPQDSNRTNYCAKNMQIKKELCF